MVTAAERGAPDRVRRTGVIASWARALMVPIATAVLLAIPAAASAHPLHTTLTDVTTDPARGMLRVTIRVFADDFSAAAARHSGLRPPADHRVADPVIARYVAARVQLLDAGGRRASLSWGGARREGEMIWITVYVPALRSLAGVRIGNSLMLDVFDDQVNIVRAQAGSRRSSVLFTKGDRGRVKPLA